MIGSTRINIRLALFLLMLWNCSMAERTTNQEVDFQNVMNICNSSFSIPMEYLSQFNATGQLPDTKDKTGMCYIRCFYERSGLIDNWKLNKPLVQQTMWPATGDSIEVCEQEGNNEENPCERTYAIAKCLMTRAIVDARNKLAI